MGDPKKLKKKYSAPPHPWQASRILEEREIIEGYGLKNKKEIWKATSFLRKIKNQAKILIASTSQQGKKEEQQLLQKLQKLNLLTKESRIEDVLNLQTNNILDRRLQTQVFKQGLARTPRQSRQFIKHGHISVSGHGVNIPSYLLNSEEESQITFSPSSAFKDEEHPERKIEKKEKSKLVKPLKKETDKSEPKQASSESKDKPSAQEEKPKKETKKAKTKESKKKRYQ